MKQLYYLYHLQILPFMMNVISLWSVEGLPDIRLLWPPQEQVPKILFSWKDTVIWGR